MSERKSDARDGLGWGLVLVAMGVVFLLAQRDLLLRHWLHSWWTWWPAILVAIGISKLVRARHPGHVGSGVTMMLIGVWFFANQYEWYGLSWGNSWPLALVAVGAGTIARAIAQGVMREAGKEESGG